MKISECSYCGTLAITDNDVCSSCQQLFSPETPPAAQNDPPSDIGGFQQNSQVVATSGYPASTNNEYAATPPPPQYQQSPTPPVIRPFPGSQNAPPQAVFESNCMKCGTPLPRGQRSCFNCENRKSAPWKKLTFLTLLAVAIGFFSFDYVYEQVSPRGILRKYAKTTGADEAVVYENFVLKGDTSMSVSNGSIVNAKTFSESQASREIFKFKMIFKKPNVSGVEFTRDGEAGPTTVFKQVYDGTRGWQYTNMPNQPAGYKDTEDGFGSKKMGMGMDEYDSLEFSNEAIEQEYGKDNIKILTDITEIEVADIKKPSAAKTIVLGKRKNNGSLESSLLVFDQSTGILIGMLKKATMGTTPVMTIIYMDKYAKFPVKRNGWFGVEETRILVPSKMSFILKPGSSAQTGGAPVLMIQMNVKTVETDGVIEDGYFQKQ